MTNTRILLAVAAVGLVGCSGPDPVNQTHQGTLAQGDTIHPDDHSFYDEYTVEVGEGYMLSVTMTSAAFDSYLHVHGPNGEDMQDDNTGGGQNARIQQAVPVAGSWRIWANSRAMNETGAYTLVIATTPPP